MRWEALFEDLEAQLAAAELASIESEVSERVRMEQAAISLADRLRGQLNRRLRVKIDGGNNFEGELTYVGSEWMVLREGIRSVLLPFPALQTLVGFGRFSAVETSAGRQRLGVATAYRALSRDRSHITAFLRTADRNAAISGTIDRVGLDFIELALAPLGEARSADNVSGVCAVPFSAIAAVSSHR